MQHSGAEQVMTSGLLAVAAALTAAVVARLVWQRANGRMRDGALLSKADAIAALEEVIPRGTGYSY